MTDPPAARAGQTANKTGMPGFGDELHELLKLALDKSVEGRQKLTASLGDLFGDRATVLTERERALMSDILRKLLHDCEMAVRRDLAILARNDAASELGGNAVAPLGEPTEDGRQAFAVFRCEDPAGQFGGGANR